MSGGSPVGLRGVGRGQALVDEGGAWGECCSMFLLITDMRLTV